jgi:hypothetical protein
MTNKITTKTMRSLVEAANSVNEAARMGNFGTHKTSNYGPFELWWVGDGAGRRYFEVKKGGRTLGSFPDAKDAEHHIAQIGGIGYLLQRNYKDFWNSGFGDFVSSLAPIDGMTKGKLQEYLKNAIEMYEDDDEPRMAAIAKNALRWVKTF